MTQLYVGNLSTDADDKVLRALFGKYGPIRETIMKNGYAFLEYEGHVQADSAMSELNGAEVLGSHLIVEPSHQQRITKQNSGWNNDSLPVGSKKMLSSRVEITDIPMCLTWEAVESQLASMGNIIKSEHDIDDYGNLTGYVMYETVDQAQRAELAFKGDENMFRVMMWDDRRPASAGAMRGGRKLSLSGASGPQTPSKQNNDFPLRIVVPTDMIGAIIGKDGATIRAVTVTTKARVDVHRRENLGNSAAVNQAEKTITINGPPECCTDACHMIMKIMQAELLTQTGYTNLQGPLDRLPSVPLKILSHNDLIGRVIGKGGNTLKRIMQESGTKITISKLKELTPQKPERTITIMGTVDNCKKAESLISAKLRASYENDMAHLIPQQQQALTPVKFPPQPPASVNLYPGLSISADQADHFMPSSTLLANTMASPNFASSTPPSFLTSGMTSTETLELNGLQGFTLPSHPHDTTLAATQLGNAHQEPPSPKPMTTNGGPPPSLPTRGRNLTLNRPEDLHFSEMDPLAHSMGYLSMTGGGPGGGRGQPDMNKSSMRPRRSSVPGVINPPPPMWINSPPNGRPMPLTPLPHQNQSIGSHSNAFSPPIVTGQQIFPRMSVPGTREAWQNTPTSRPKTGEGKPLDRNYMQQKEEILLPDSRQTNTFYNQMQQGQTFPYFQPSSAPPYIEPTHSFGQYGGTVMTSKLLGSPIKVKPEEDFNGPPMQAWGQGEPQNMSSAKANLAFTFDFPHYTRPTLVPNNGANTSNAFTLPA